MTTNAPTSEATTTAPPTFVRPIRAARGLWVLDHRVRVLAGEPESGGRFSLVEVLAPAGIVGPPMHAHDDCDEVMHVLEGGMKVVVDGQAAIARAGDTIVIPRGRLHTFGNPYLSPCRFLEQYTPGGFEKFFEAVGVPPTDPAEQRRPANAPAPTPERLRALAIQFRIRVPGLTE